MANKEVEISFEELVVAAHGEYSESWKADGVSWKFSISFPEPGKTALVQVWDGPQEGVADRLALKLEFAIEKGLKLDARTSLYFHQGHGNYTPYKGRAKQLSDEKMIVFIIGPQLVFGIDIPHCLLHDLRLKKRKLVRPLELDDTPR